MSGHTVIVVASTRRARTPRPVRWTSRCHPLEHGLSRRRYRCAAVSHLRSSRSSIPAHATQKETRQSRGAATPSANLVTKSMNYSTSAERTTAVATALAELGVHPRDRVLIMLPDGPGFAEAFAGTIQHQAVPLPVNPLAAAPDM